MWVSAGKGRGADQHLRVESQERKEIFIKQKMPRQLNDWGFGRGLGGCWVLGAGSQGFNIYALWILV